MYDDVFFGHTLAYYLTELTSNPLVVLGLVATYVVPTFIAGARQHHQRRSILLLNLLLGWTVLGWIAALAWACTSPTAPRENAPTP